MTKQISSALSELSKRALENSNEHGIDHVLKMQAAARPLLLWIDHLSKCHLTGHANALLDGVRSAVNEAAACLSLGLARPALMSIRLQIDLALGWIYFKDHHVEWGRVQQTGDGYKTKKELIDYFREYDDYGSRYGILKACCTRKELEPYRLLSAHIHAQSEFVIPRVVSPVDVVAPLNLQTDVIALQSETSEYLSDVYWSLYADQWPSLPAALREALDLRFQTSNQKLAFYTPPLKQ